MLRQTYRNILILLSMVSLMSMVIHRK